MCIFHCSGRIFEDMSQVLGRKSPWFLIFRGINLGRYALGGTTSVDGWNPAIRFGLVTHGDPSIYDGFVLHPRQVTGLLDLFHQEDVHGYNPHQQVNRSGVADTRGARKTMSRPASPDKDTRRSRARGKGPDWGIMEFPSSEPTAEFVMGFVDDWCTAGKGPVLQHTLSVKSPPDHANFLGRRFASYVVLQVTAFDVRSPLKSQGVTNSVHCLRTVSQTQAMETSNPSNWLKWNDMNQQFSTSTLPGTKESNSSYDGPGWKGVKRFSLNQWHYDTLCVFSEALKRGSLLVVKICRGVFQVVWFISKVSFFDHSHLRVVSKRRCVVIRSDSRLCGLHSSHHRKMNNQRCSTLLVDEDVQLHAHACSCMHVQEFFVLLKPSDMLRHSAHAEHVFQFMRHPAGQGKTALKEMRLLASTLLVYWKVFFFVVNAQFWCVRTHPAISFMNSWRCHSETKRQKSKRHLPQIHTVDGSEIRRAPVDSWFIPLFTRF